MKPARQILELVANDVLPAQEDDDAERAELHEGVDEQIHQRRRDTACVASARRHDANQEIPGVRNRRVRKHAFQVALRQRGKVADRHRHDGQHFEQDSPVRAQRRHALEKEAQQHRKRRRLRAH
jgi:hypothetical protein